MYATVASLVGGQVAMSAYVERNNTPSATPKTTRSADTILAKSSVTTKIPETGGGAVPFGGGDDGAATTTTTTGPTWEMWDRASVLPSMTEGHACRWTNLNVGENTVPMCVHPQTDIISDRIVRTGGYGHCNHLVKLWNEAENASASSVSSTSNSNNNNGGGSLLRGNAAAPKRRDRDHFFLDIGANIGACLLTVLLSTPPSTKVVAFEPHPDNAFCLTSTLMSLPSDLRDRVYFYPIALGSSRSHNNTPSRAKLYGQSDNMGNSVVHKMAGLDNYSVKKHLQSPVDIVVEPLDQVIKLQSSSSSSSSNGKEITTIPLVKLDGQGFECEILKGMESVLPFVGSITMDVYGSMTHQAQFGCDAYYVFKILKKYNFHVYVNGVRMTAPPPGTDGYEIVARSFDRS